MTTAFLTTSPAVAAGPGGSGAPDRRNLAEANGHSTNRAFPFPSSPAGAPAAASPAVATSAVGLTHKQTDLPKPSGTPWLSLADRLDHSANAVSSLLTFAETPSHIARLRFSHQRMSDVDTALVSAADLPSVSTPVKQTVKPRVQTPASSPTPTSSPLRPARRVGFAPQPEDSGQNSASRGDQLESGRPRISSTASSSSSLSAPVLHQLPRKPSPGLAARLKALGFGAALQKDQPASSPHQPDHIGRLPEDQLRQIDEKHQAGSSVPVIERRGRPWKGAGFVVARLPSSVSSLAGGRTNHAEVSAADAGADYDANYDANSTASNTDGSIANTAIVVVTTPDDKANKAQSAAAAVSTDSFLPEIRPSKPLEMDTNKYRLPDHTNGNGTKVQLDTRQQHIARDSNPSTSSNSLTQLVSSDVPPPPLPKDTPPLPSYARQQQQPAPGAPEAASQPDFDPESVSYFNPLGLQRPGSIYTLSRLSFANQLAQLTSLQLPDAESLSSRVSAIPTAQAAARALVGAAEQIRNWIAKASEVIDGLDSDDDVEWAAAGGREGLEEVENAILRFEELINVYVSAIEELQGRPDIANVTPEDLQRAVFQMESIMEEWGRMRSALQSVKAQVEIAMEWEELWGSVLGDIQNEMDELSRLVFEMEERRHRSMTGAPGTDGSGVDIGDLETIVEESQQQQLPHSSAGTRVASSNNRFSIPIFPASPMSPDAQSSTPSFSQDDSSLLALFARMQPLRASLDFLPMRLSVFETRASSCFPTACDELEMRRAGLDGSYKKLEKDAESLRKELGEDRWVTVFRGAARQAQKMYESVERSVAKLKEGLDAGMHLTNQPGMVKKIESYETKKMHYGPAIERVLAIIDKGIQERLTLNGEILRLHAELQSLWDTLRDRMRDLDLAIEELHADDHRNEQLRDSVSSMLSNDRSTIGSGHDTPQSSPPSSVIMSSLGLESSSKRAAAAQADAKGTPTNNKRRSLLGSHLPQPANRRSVSSSAAAATPPQTRKPFSRFSSSLGLGSSIGSGLSSPSREGSATPVGARIAARTPRTSSTMEHRPRWNTSTTGIDTGHNFKPLTLTTPSPYMKTPPSARRSVTSLVASGGRPGSSLSSRLPMRSPLSRAGSSSPIPEGTPLRDPPGFRDAPPYRPPRLANSATTPAVASSRRVSMQPQRSAESAPAVAPRPASSLATSRRTSMLPAPRKREGSVSGRESPQAIAGARFAMRKQAAEAKPNEKPRWRP